MLEEFNPRVQIIFCKKSAKQAQKCLGNSGAFLNPKTLGEISGQIRSGRIGSRISIIISNKLVAARFRWNSKIVNHDVRTSRHLTVII